MIKLQLSARQHKGAVSSRMHSLPLAQYECLAPRSHSSIRGPFCRPHSCGWCCVGAWGGVMCSLLLSAVALVFGAVICTSSVWIRVCICKSISADLAGRKVCLLNRRLKLNWNQLFCLKPGGFICFLNMCAIRAPEGCFTLTLGRNFFKSCILFV